MVGTGIGGTVLRGSLFLLLGLGGGWAGQALANQQIEDEEGSLEQAERDAERARTYGELVDLRLYGGSGFVIGSEYGEFQASSYQPAGRVKLTLPVASNAMLRMILRGSALLTDFDDVETDLFGTPTASDPFGDLYATSFEIQGGLRPGWRGLFSEEERWTLVAEGSARARWERGASFGSSVTGGGALGVGYQIGDWLEVIVGAGIESRYLGGGVSIRPVFELDWHFAERWRLGTRGIGGQIEYDVHDGLSVFASAQLESRSFLTRNRGAGVGEGRLRESALPVGIGLRWDLSDYAELTLVGGARLRQEVRAEDEDREDLGHVRAGPAPYVGITFELQPDGRRRKAAAAAKARQRAPGGDSSSTSISTSR